MARRPKDPLTAPGPRPLPPDSKTATLESPALENERSLVYLAERLRRIALGLTAALVTARAFWPSEPNLQAGAGDGLLWVLILLVAVGIALAVPLLGGRLRFRWSLTDALVFTLVTLVAATAAHALDRRPAINLAWEWAGLGFVYLLLRNLPRTRSESKALAGAIVATAVAVSAYGLYQVKVEIPLLQAEFKRNPRQVMQKLNIEPNTRSEEMLKNRLMQSSEPFSTFTLANSLAAYLAGGLVLLVGVTLTVLVRPGALPSRWPAVAMVAPLALVLLVCLLLTKSRSAYLGVFISSCLLAWHARKQASPRVLIALAVSSCVVVAGLVVAGLATRRLDPLVLTQSPKSLRYRLEYWQGTWGVITEGASTLSGALQSPTFWWGLGPGNFSGPYLKYKLPEASEEIVDPHNLFLEVWASSGIWALACLVLALGFAFWNLFGPPKPAAVLEAPDLSTRRLRRRERRLARDHPQPNIEEQPEDSPPARAGWLLICAGSGWALVVLCGWLNPFEDELFSRWLILGASWLAAALLGASLWKSEPVPAYVLGAAALAIAINLLAGQGIGIPTVAMALWSLIALGLNLRDDRPCSRIREYDSRMPSLGLAVAWSALLGTFLGMIGPFWRCETAIARGDAALKQLPPDYELAEKAYIAAAKEDGYSPRPWLNLAAMYWMAWRERGAKVEDKRWMQIAISYDMASAPPRNPLAPSLHSERAIWIGRLLGEIGSRLTPLELTKYKGKIVEATRTATRLNPTSALLHARLAEASADIMMFKDAAEEGAEALRLDDLNPHPDKKLLETRRRLETLIPQWTESAAKTKAIAPP